MARRRPFSRMSRTRTRVGVTLLAALTFAPAAAEARSTYWNLLGIGQGETVNTVEFTTSTAAGQPPPSFVNQRDLFNALLPAAPKVTTSQLGRFFKPAPLAP